MTDYNTLSELPKQQFSHVAKQMLAKCNSDAFVFVNMPGISKLDLSMWSTDQWTSLVRYIEGSSTALKFEKVEVNEEEPDLFTELIDFTALRCHLQDIITIRGNKTEDFEPYIDSRGRIIRIDYPPLPVTYSIDGKSRDEVIKDYDKFLRYVLAQLPSPHHTVIFTSLEAQPIPRDDNWIALDIFPQIFDDASRNQDIERNNKILDVRPPFNTHRPKFTEPSSNYMTIFDEDFLKENSKLLRWILLVAVGYVTVHIVLYLQKQRFNDNDKKSD